jgi:hypothetical protein
MASGDDDPFGLPSDNEETEDQLRKRVCHEQKMFLRNKLVHRKNPVVPPARASYKSKRGEAVVNKRQLKSCPICLRVTKQLTRHIKTVHADVSGVRLIEACKIAKVRELAEQDAQLPCPVCGTMRSNVRSHLIKVHSVSKNQPTILKELQPTTVAITTHKVRNNSVAQWIKEYERTHFNQFDGAHLSSKASTRKKQIGQKVGTVGQMLDFLVTRTDDCSIEGVLKEIRALFAQPDGYVWTRNGKYATVVRDLDYFKEFCAYARREGLANPLIVSTAIERITMARKNAKNRQNEEYAIFQDQDGKRIVRQSDIEAFNRSAQALKAVADLKGKDTLGKRGAVNARNFAITTLLLENNCRPSDLDGIQQVDLDEAKKKPRREMDGAKYYSVCSTTSKNIGSSGLPTYLLITQEMMLILDNYRRKARKVLATDVSNDALFVKENGEPMVHENISQGYRSIWRAAANDNLALNKDLNSRHLRHSANGIAKLCGNKDLRDTVHIGLNHNRRSNDASYMSIVRPIITLKAKLAIKKLRETDSNKFEQLLAGQEDERVKQQWDHPDEQPLGGVNLKKVDKGGEKRLEKIVLWQQGRANRSEMRTKGKTKRMEVQESQGGLQSVSPGRSRPRRISKAPTKLNL